MTLITMPPRPLATVMRNAGLTQDASELHQTIRKVIRWEAKMFLAGTTLFTDNSGGVLNNPAVVSQPVACVDTPAAGSSLTDPTTFSSDVTAAINDLATMFSVVNAVLVKLGLAAVPYAGGGAANGTTLVAEPVAVTGAATGVPSANVNATLTAIANAQFMLGDMINSIAEATGGKTQNQNLVSFSAKVVLNFVTGVVVIPNSVGVAAATASTAAAATAALTVLRNNTSTLAAEFAVAVAGYQTMPVVAQ